MAENMGAKRGAWMCGRGSVSGAPATVTGARGSDDAGKHGGTGGVQVRVLERESVRAPAEGEGEGRECERGRGRIRDYVS